jgi:ribosomal protein S18 acetylase RimI-like enzyme
MIRFTIRTLPPVDVTIRAATRADYPAWKDLWEQYLVFYETELPPEHTDRLWQKLLDESDPAECLVAEVDGEVAGMVQFFPHTDLWEEQPACYLSDLYVDPAWRGRGIGAALIRAVEERSRDRGWAYVYWQTAEDNHRARGMYDTLTGGASGFVIYELRK